MNKLIAVLFILCVVAVVYTCVECRAEEMDLTKAVIHHTASGDVSANEIDYWHRERGWKMIGYHYVIRYDGTIEAGRPITMQGAHTKGRNHYIGIVLTGYDEFTVQQLFALKNLLKRLEITHIERHHNLCPSDGLNVEEIQEELNNYYDDK